MFTDSNNNAVACALISYDGPTTSLVTTFTSDIISGTITFTQNANDNSSETGILVDLEPIGISLPVRLLLGCVLLDLDAALSH